MKSFTSSFIYFLLFLFVLGIKADCSLFNDLGINIAGYKNDFNHFYWCCESTNIILIGEVCSQCCEFPLYPALLVLLVAFLCCVGCCGFCCAICLKKKKKGNVIETQTLVNPINQNGPYYTSMPTANNPPAYNPESV
eukprot:TRINITY_DN410_c0_g1_i1.p1 TRINITY_DN410_c0_g1~~TRINITY_DN410_c0_g1_i1.p1  ORF type:complete len:145 (-),score=29.53 TRINITY_DN410_c0_g1_i1:95-505(-)